MRAAARDAAVVSYATVRWVQCAACLSQRVSVLFRDGAACCCFRITYATARMVNASGAARCKRAGTRTGRHAGKLQLR